MDERFTTRSPIDGQVYLERTYANATQVEQTLASAVAGQRAMRALSVQERMGLCAALVDAMLAQRASLAEELTWQMGRPSAHAASEFRGFEERARRMIELAEGALADTPQPPREGFQRWIRREPLGVVLVLSPWNFPYLTSVNVVIPALLAGNAVVLKHAEQTPLCAERYAAAARQAGLPEGALQFLHLTHRQVANVIRDGRVAQVAFTGSVQGGRAVAQAAAPGFVGAGLELGGKDPAYVCEDADLDFAATELADGALFNAGQSCCGIERIYVHQAVYDKFVERLVGTVQGYVLGDPREATTTLGPLARVQGAEQVNKQVRAALAAGATGCIDPSRYGATKLGVNYVAPQVLVDVTHDMAVMREETFGPVVGVMRVPDDASALALMNDSVYGLTASIWTADLERAARLGDEVQTGTVFANRCDYLDPDLPWTGVKDSGLGCTLSALGFGQLTRPKSFHLRSQR